MSLTIKQVRSQLGLTQTKMATLLGMSQSRIAEIEGKSTRTETNQHLATLELILFLHNEGLIDKFIKRRES